MAASTAKSTQLSAIEIYKEAFSILTTRFSECVPLLGLMVLSAVLSIVSSSVDHSLLNLLISLFQIAAGFVTMWGALQVVRRKKFDIMAKFQDFSGMWKYFLTTFVVGLLVMIGMIFLIIPGIYLALKYGLASLVSIDKGTSVGSSMETAAKMISGNMVALILFAIVTIIVNILGGLALGVGLIFTVPLSQFAGVIFYERLKK